MACEQILYRKINECNIAQFVIIGVLVFFQFFSYTIDVLVSEAIIYFIMDALHVDYDNIEVL